MSLQAGINVTGVLCISPANETGRYAIEQWLGAALADGELPQITINGQQGHFTPRCGDTCYPTTTPTAEKSPSPASGARNGIDEGDGARVSDAREEK